MCLVDDDDGNDDDGNDDDDEDDDDDDNDVKNDTATAAPMVEATLRD